MTDERRDDEIIGRALSRAIETIDVNQTPFERSRIATAPARRSIFGLWQFATAAAAIVLALAIGSWLTRPTEGQPGVAASPTAPASGVPTIAPTATPVEAPSVPTWVYFARDGLPPVGAFVPGSAPISASQGLHIAERLVGLRNRAAGLIPAGATNPMSLVAFNPNGDGPTPMQIGFQGDLATVEFDVVPGWGIRGAAQSQALLQQLVYTITEEPGIRRALITEKGKSNAVIDQLVIDEPLTREDVFGYSSTAKLGTTGAIADGGNTAAQYQVATTNSVDTLAPGLARVVLTFKSPGGADVSELPEFVASIAQSDQADPNNAKYLLSVELHAARVTWMTADTVVDRSPLRFVGVNGSTVRIGLDDARPWRLFTLTNPARIVVDIGGPTRSVSDRVAVYQPRPGATVTRDLQLTGAARVFEANVVWRLKDSSGRDVANGNFLASLGSSPVWGTFDTRIAIPASVSGNVTLEVFEASAMDGSPQGVTQIPLTVR
jgi:immunoglobulin-like protein involved in spore germination